MKTRIAYDARSRSMPIAIAVAVGAVRVPAPNPLSAMPDRHTPASGSVAGNIGRG
jgi:hypothetical protein